MRLPRIIKQNYEKFFIDGDFAAVMDASEVISTYTATAYDNIGADATTIVIDSAATFISGKKQFVRIQAGDAVKSPYKITLKVVTDQGNQWEVDIEMVIMEL